MSNGNDGPEPEAPTSAVDAFGQDTNERSTSSRSKRRSRNKRQRFKNKTENLFTGETVEMNKNVFQTLPESNDHTQFTTSLEALERYINKKLRYPRDLNSLHQRLTMPTLMNPADITADHAKNAAKLLVWSKNKKELLKEKAST